MSKNPESDEELRERLQLRVLQSTTRRPSGPWEHDMMRKGLIEAVSNPAYVDDKRLKWIYSIVFGTMIETLEVQQIHQMQLSMDNQFDKERKAREKDKAENKSEHRLFKYGILGIAIASGVLGILSEEAIAWIARIFGM